MPTPSTATAASVNTVEAAIAGVGSKATFAGAGTTVAGWVFSSEFAAMSGILLGLAGLLVNWYFKRRRDLREQEEHVARMRKLATRPGDLP